ncbi:MAG: helix-turn-helix domain-containing protein [Prevotellaceae bacterium]|jgi:transcriptional regulator with XRE-family HTH domain|nr:helix-turn-helix domain-containing protein [Prevotellaceae bacterium]
MKNLEKYGDRIRLLRSEKKLTQENMANDLGISVTAYSKIERGKTNISMSRLKQIAEALGVSTLKITHPDMENNTEGSFIVKEPLHQYGEFNTVSLVQRIHRLQDEIAQLHKILADKEDIIALLKEKIG